MPLTDTTPQVVLINNESDLIPLPVSGGVVIPSGSSGLLMLGIQSGSNTTEFLKILSGSLLVSGSVTINNPGSSNIGTVTQGSSGSIPWKVTLFSGSAQTGIENNPVFTSIPKRQFFSVFAQNVATANSKNMLSIFNGSTTKNIVIKKIILTNVRQAATTGIFIRQNIYRITSHSAGSLLTIGSWDTRNTLDPNITARTNSNTTVTGSVLYSFFRVTEEHSSTTLKPGVLDNINPDGQDFAGNIAGNGIVAIPSEGFTILLESTAGTTGVFDVTIVFEQVDI